MKANNAVGLMLVGMVIGILALVGGFIFKIWPSLGAQVQGVLLASAIWCPVVLAMLYMLILDRRADVEEKRLEMQMRIQHSRQGAFTYNPTVMQPPQTFRGGVGGVLSGLDDLTEV